MSKEPREKVRVSPMHRFKSRGTVHTEEYSYSEVHLDDALDNIDSIFDVSGAEAWVEDGEIHYQYQDRPEIVIRSSGVFVDTDENIEDAENQAYFALSMMAGSGYVSNWRKE